MKKKVILGQSDFCEYRRDENSYYVDKSLLIKDVIDNSYKTILLPRPRRFGKTLNISMLRYFFEKSEDCKQDCFEDLKIWKEGEDYLKHFNKYPVIFVTFNDCKHRNWEKCYEDFKERVIKIYKQFSYLKKELDEDEQLYYNSILNRTARQSDYEKSLKKISFYIKVVTGDKLVILFDEYDTPIHQAFINGYYDMCIEFMKNFLHGAFKDNKYLEKGVITGILQVAKENIFSGLNNIGIYNILDEKFSNKFGLEEEEVIELLEYFELSDRLEDVRDWFNSYIFGITPIYNPWSVLSFSQTPTRMMKPYWKKSSGNDLIRILIENADYAVKGKIKDLIEGKIITEKIADETILTNLLNSKYSEKDLWAMLLYSGYLVVVKQNVIRGKVINYNLKIPNLEVETIYEDIFAQIADNKIGSNELDSMLKALLNKDYKKFQSILQRVCLKTLSYHDTAYDKRILEAPEQVYHAFLLGVFINLNNEYIIDSNKEVGDGRFDIILEPRDTSKTAFVIELKIADDDDSLETAVNDALKQIEEKQYEARLIDRGIEKIEKLGMAFIGRKALVSNKLIEIV